MMHCILYEFKVKEGQESLFESSWAKVTSLFIKHANGLGSRLHKVEGNTYIAYAQWPDRNTRDSASLPDNTKAIQDQMRNCCESITVLHRMEQINNLLIH